MRTTLAVGLSLALVAAEADACTRVLYESGGGYVVARSMDWMEDTQTDLWAFPRGMARDGGVGERSVRWTSKYGSVIASMYDGATVDGMNEAGLSGNALYLAEAEYGDAATSNKPLISIGAWLQYALDNYATVAEAVDALEKDPFVIVAPTLPNGSAATGHVALADATGDSAIFEYLDGKLVVHHGSEYKVMTNSPPYDQQLAITAYWDEIGGLQFLPGTNRAADRFARVSWNLNAVPKAKDPKQAIAVAFSLIRAVSVPLGISDPSKPNIASTTWRTVADLGARRYFYESAFSPSIFWVDLDKLDLAEGATPMKLDLQDGSIHSGESSAAFEPAQPFAFLSSD